VPLAVRHEVVHCALWGNFAAVIERDVPRKVCGTSRADGIALSAAESTFSRFFPAETTSGAHLCSPSTDYPRSRD
jgi:hypothetical protein